MTSTTGKAPGLHPRIALLDSLHRTIAAPVLESKAASESALEWHQILNGTAHLLGSHQVATNLFVGGQLKTSPGRLCPAIPESTLQASLLRLCCR